MAKFNELQCNKYALLIHIQQSCHALRLLYRHKHSQYETAIKSMSQIMLNHNFTTTQSHLLAQ